MWGMDNFKPWPEQKNVESQEEEKEKTKCGGDYRTQTISS